MKNYRFIFILLLLPLVSCVQKASNKTVVFTLDTQDVPNIKTVSIRGGERPLNWQYDTPMTVIKKDSLYQASVTFLTGYKFTEVKFVINDQFELIDQDNRHVFFSDKDTTFYQAKFDIVK